MGHSMASRAKVLGLAGLVAVTAALDSGCTPSDDGPPTASDAGDEPDDEDVDAGPLVVDDLGYAIHGGNWFPPLRRRVTALPCPAPPFGVNECTTDDECGMGFACVCDVSAASKCVPAECRSDDECANGLCLVSRGGEAACPERCPSGLYCERPDSTCEADNWCPGNGTYCTYVAARDRFECSNPTCRCE